MIPAWSYSSIKTFDQCPKKYYHLKIVKDVKDGDSTATIYGKELHTAANLTSQAKGKEQWLNYRTQ